MRVLLFGVVVVGVGLGGLRLAAHLREGDVALPQEMRMLPHPDGDIALLEVPPVGEGRGDVLLIHGSVGYGLTWLHTAEMLAGAGYRPVAIDLPPMGFSDRELDGDYGRRASAERILRVVEQMEMRPHLVAHSFGAGAAVEAAMLAPERFASLTIIAGALALDPEAGALPWVLEPLWLREVAVSATVTNPLAARPLLQAFLHRDDRASDDVLEVLARPAGRYGATEALARWVPNLLITPPELPSAQSAAYREITLPTALIWGAEDTTTPLAQGERLAELIAGAELFVLPDVGHIPMIEDPEAFDAALLSALAGMAP